MRQSFTVLAHSVEGVLRKAFLCTNENQGHPIHALGFHCTRSLAVGQLNEQYYRTVVKVLGSEFTMLPRIKSWFTPTYSLPLTGFLTLYIYFLICKMDIIIVSNIAL